MHMQQTGFTGDQAICARVSDNLKLQYCGIIFLQPQISICCKYMKQKSPTGKTAAVTDFSLYLSVCRSVREYAQGMERTQAHTSFVE